jgi:hypothetical protein
MTIEDYARKVMGTLDAQATYFRTRSNLPECKRLEYELRQLTRSILVGAQTPAAPAQASLFGDGDGKPRSALTGGR